MESSQYKDPCSLFVGRLILRPAKLTPQGFFWLDPLISDSRKNDKHVLRAMSGRDRGYFANGFVALSTSEAPRGLSVLADKVGFKQDWTCVEVIYVAERYVKAIMATGIEKEKLEAYYRWVADHPDTQISFDEWLSGN